MPVYIAVLFLMHAWLGWFAVGGSLLLFLLATANEIATRQPLTKANALAIAGRNDLGGNLRNAEVLEAMGMLRHIHHRWSMRYREMLKLQSLASDRAALLANARACHQL